MWPLEQGIYVIPNKVKKLLTVGDKYKIIWRDNFLSLSSAAAESFPTLSYLNDNPFSGQSIHSL